MTGVISELEKMSIDKEARYEAIKELIQAKNINLTTDLTDPDISCFVRASIIESYLINKYLSPKDKKNLQEIKDATGHPFDISLSGIAKERYMEYRIPRNRQRALEYLKAIIGSEKPAPQQKVLDFVRRDTL